MSVILDALKRVQEEDRNTGRGAARPGRGAGEDNDALMRRLAGGPSEARKDAPVELSRAGRVGLLILCLVAIVAVASWAFDPSLGSLGAGDDRPLLSDLTGARRPAADPTPVRRSEPATQAEPEADEGTLFREIITPAEEPQVEIEPVSRQSQSGGGNEPPVRESQETVPAGAYDSGRGFSDLSGNLPADTAAPANSGAASANNDGYIRLTSDYEAPEETPQNERDVVVLGSERAQADRAPQGLVDPGVRAAFENGVRLQKAGDFVGAEEAYKRALKFDPYNAKVNANLGVLYESQDRLTLAERHLRQAVAIAPDSANAHNNLGVVLYRLGNYDGALIEFNRTLALDPSILDAYTNKGLIFTRWGRYEDAERAFLQVLQRDPENGLAHYNLGLVYEETDQIARAVERYYDFIATDGATHPEIVEYLAEHLPWLEARLEGGDAGVSR